VQKIPSRYPTGKNAVNLTPEQEFEVKASTLNREQLYNLAKKQAAHLQVVAQMRQAQKALLAKHNEDNLREVNRLQSAVDYRLAELGVKAV
jgi:hypothetical protein